LCICSITSAATPTAPEEDVTKVLLQRQALIDGGGHNAMELSTWIILVVDASQKLAQKGNYQSALNSLLLLEKFGPLIDLPGYNLHLLCSQVYGKLGKMELSKKHMVLANAYGVMLDQRIGKGDKESDPLRVIMGNEVFDWLAVHHAQIQKMNAADYKTGKLMTIDYLDRLGNSRTHHLYVLQDDRVPIPTDMQSTQNSSSPAVADNAPSRVDQAHMFIDLWRATCATYYGNPLGLRAAALKAGYQENPSYADSQLLGTPGTVWDASSRPSAQASLKPNSRHGFSSPRRPTIRA
jgi:hypothetical protein